MIEPMTPAEVAALLGTTVEGVKKRRLAGLLRGIPETPGGQGEGWQSRPRKYLYERADVLAYLERRKGAA